MELLEIIRNSLAKGDMKRISDITSLDYFMVCNHISGKVKNPNQAIIDAAISIIEERKTQNKKSIERLSRVI